jgi:hypothetical protein
MYMMSQKAKVKAVSASTLLLCYQINEKVPLLRSSSGGAAKGKGALETKLERLYTLS